MCPAAPDGHAGPVRLGPRRRLVEMTSSRLLDVVQGRWGTVLPKWIGAQPKTRRDGDRVAARPVSSRRRSRCSTAAGPVHFDHAAALRRLLVSEATSPQIGTPQRIDSRTATGTGDRDQGPTPVAGMPVRLVNDLKELRVVDLPDVALAGQVRGTPSPATPPISRVRTLPGHRLKVRGVAVRDPSYVP